MIDGSEKRNRQLAFELPNSHVCEKRQIIFLKLIFKSTNRFPLRLGNFHFLHAHAHLI